MVKIYLFFLEDEFGDMQEVPNQSESMEESDQGKEVTSVQVDKTEKGKQKKRESRRMTQIQEDVLTNLVHEFDRVNIDMEKHSAEVPCLSDMSLDEYNDLIAQLVNDYDEKMKQPVEETNFTVVGSNLLPATQNGEVLGTVTDQMLMLLQTLNTDQVGKEDSTDEQVTKNNEDISEDEIVEDIDLIAYSSGIKNSIPNNHHSIFSTQSTVGRNISYTEQQEIHSEPERDEQSSELKDMVDDILDGVFDSVFYRGQVDVE